MSSRIPSLNWLRVFEAAARTGSFARAAETLNMSPPAVSQQIKALEEHLGRQLFERGPRSVALTEPGRAFLPVVANSLHAVEVATGSLFGDRDRTTLTLSCTLLFANGWLAARLPKFRAAHPEIQLRLLTQEFATTAEHQNADLRISFGAQPDAFEESDHLFGEVIYPVATGEIAGQVISQEDLPKWPLIEVATHRANWFALLPEGELNPRITYTDNTTTAFSLAMQGAIALARAPASEGLPERSNLERCLPDLWVNGVQSYQLIYPARTSLGRAARAFRDWLLEEAEATLGPDGQTLTDRIRPGPSQGQRLPIRF
ncbi:MAG: LysR family transcriptional regulator [Pseudomonadota bacterium]